MACKGSHVFGGAKFDLMGLTGIGFSRFPSQGAQTQHLAAIHCTKAPLSVSASPNRFSPKIHHFSAKTADPLSPLCSSRKLVYEEDQRGGAMFSILEKACPEPQSGSSLLHRTFPERQNIRYWYLTPFLEVGDDVYAYPCDTNSEVHATVQVRNMHQGGSS